MLDQDPASNGDDQVAFVQTEFIKCGDAIRGYLLAICPDESIADDLLHNVFLAVTRKSSDFRRGTSFIAWARSIAKIEVLRLASNRARTPQLLAPDVIELLSLSAPPFSVESDRLSAMRSCLDALAPRASESITLRYLENLSPGVIADRMKLTINSVNVMLSRARLALRDCIEQRLRSTEGM